MEESVNFTVTLHSKNAIIRLFKYELWKRALDYLASFFHFRGGCRGEADVCKRFGDTDALKNINLYIRKREFVTLLGPSGCGKTTMLRIFGGFEFADEGQVLFEGKDIAAVPPSA